MGWFSIRLPARVAWLSNDVPACRDLAVVWFKRVVFGRGGRGNGVKLCQAGPLSWVGVRCRAVAGAMSLCGPATACHRLGLPAAERGRPVRELAAGMEAAREDQAWPSADVVAPWRAGPRKRV